MDKETLEWISKVEKKLEFINFELGKLIGQQRTSLTLIKYIILPLIITLAGLVGVKIW